MSADGSIVIETNIDDKNAQKELNRLNRQIKSLEEQLAAKTALTQSTQSWKRLENDLQHCRMNRVSSIFQCSLVCQRMTLCDHTPINP